MTNFNTKYQSVCGIDIAKNVIQIYQVNQDGECKNFQVKRKEFLQLFENREPSLIGMEACGCSQYWARELQKLGHTVNLMAPSAVKPYVSGFKSDRKDAIGIFNAMLAGVRKVAVKTEAVTDLATLLGIRARRVRARTAKVNMVRGYLMEYGIVMAKGLRQFKNSIADSLLQLERAQASNMVKEEFKFLVDEVNKETEAILRLDREINSLAKQCKNFDHFLTAPGVGPITAATICAKLADPQVFKNGRQFAAYIGLVPQHYGSGGKNVNTTIPIKCNKELRALLVQCAQSIRRTKNKSSWVTQIEDRKPNSVATIAVANRLARRLWAIASKGEDWKRMDINFG